MTNVWTKIRIGFKIAVAALITAYVLLFVLKNNEQPVSLWLWPNAARWQANVPLLIFLTLLAGVIATIVLRMLWKTIRQIRDMRQRTRIERLERQVADQKTSAAKLQTREDHP